MNKQSKAKLKKKKDREKRVKEKVTAKRMAVRKDNKRKKEEEALFDAEASQFDRIEPYRKPDIPSADLESVFEKIDETEEEKNARILTQLEHNMEILQALEEEHLLEKMKQEEVNQRLEDAGCHTMEEKMAFLKKEVEKEVEPYHMQELEDLDPNKAPTL